MPGTCNIDKLHRAPAQKRTYGEDCLIGCQKRFRRSRSLSATRQASDPYGRAESAPYSTPRGQFMGIGSRYGLAVCKSYLLRCFFAFLSCRAFSSIVACWMVFGVEAVTWPPPSHQVATDRAARR